MNIWCAKGFDPSEILDHATGLGVEQGLVDPKNMAIPMNEDYWSRESQAFGLKRTEEFIVGCFCLFLRQLYRRIQHVPPETDFRPGVLKPRIGLGNDHDGSTPVPFGKLEIFRHPRYSRISLSVLSIHFTCAPKVIVATHQMKRHEQHVSVCPTLIFDKL